MPTSDYYRGLGGSGEKHAPYTHQNEFLGDTKGNRDLAPNRYEYPMFTDGETGEPHAMFAHQDSFLGDTKGNRDLATDRTSGLPSGLGGGMHKAGGMNKPGIKPGPSRKY